MSFDYVRKMVSGSKARFVDTETAVDLDLVYVTDRIIIMGYPATGISALYRNRRRDVLKFINARHGDKWWIWNLCPLYENAYAPESMFNRVSRYPFPDHHPPPLPLLPLAVREMTAWLEGDSDRVAIIHCKAGKGRSGTLLCSYLLSLPQLPPPPQQDRSYSDHDLVRRIHERQSQDSLPQASQHRDHLEDGDGWIMVGRGSLVGSYRISSPNEDGSHTPAMSERIHVNPTKGHTVHSTTSSTTTISQPSPPPSLQIDVDSDPMFTPIDIGDEGRAEEKGQQDRLDGKVEQVFRLHSSRRMKPTSKGRGVSIPSQRRWCRYVNLLFTNKAPPLYLQSTPSRIRIASVTMLLQPPSAWQKPFASMVVGGPRGSGQGKAWASVARYDDEYVAELRRRGGSGEGISSEIAWGGVGGDGNFDTSKMFRSCGKLVSGELSAENCPALPADHQSFNVHHLVPDHGDSSLILDRDREFRLKLHLASMPLGWAWIIPAFHLPEPPNRTHLAGRVHSLNFSRTQIDFPLGPGASIHQVIIRLEEVADGDERDTAKLLSHEEERLAGMEDRTGEDVKEEGE